MLLLWCWGLEIKDDWYGVMFIKGERIREVVKVLGLVF